MDVLEMIKQLLVWMWTKNPFVNKWAKESTNEMIWSIWAWANWTIYILKLGIKYIAHWFGHTFINLKVISIVFDSRSLIDHVLYYIAMMNVFAWDVQKKFNIKVLCIMIGYSFTNSIVVTKILKVTNWHVNCGSIRTNTFTFSVQENYNWCLVYMVNSGKISYYWKCVSYLYENIYKCVIVAFLMIYKWM
jgi:hypothetical protein